MIFNMSESVYFEKPEEFNRIVLEFLRECIL